jgi:hypothetical protein
MLQKDILARGWKRTLITKFLSAPDRITSHTSGWGYGKRNWECHHYSDDRVLGIEETADFAHVMAKLRSRRKKRYSDTIAKLASNWSKLVIEEEQSLEDSICDALIARVSEFEEESRRAIYQQIAYSLIHEISPESLKAFYEAWHETRGYRNPLGMYTSVLSPAKEYLVATLLAKATSNGWRHGYKNGVLYIDTSAGQVSFHGYYGEYGAYEGEWSGVRNSSQILQSLYSPAGSRCDAQRDETVYVRLEPDSEARLGAREGTWRGDRANVGRGAPKSANRPEDG